jgi:hypothetical protein
MRNLLFAIILIPLMSFSQNALQNESFGLAIIKNISPISKHHNRIDTVKTICFPEVYSKTGIPDRKINDIIRNAVFKVNVSDTINTVTKLVNATYIKNKNYKLAYKINLNKGGLLSITIHVTQSKGDKTAPLYLNFDLATGKLITLHDLLNTRNDSISFFQAVVPQSADSVMNFEQSINRSNPKYSDIIEGLNNNLADFRHHYTSYFTLTEKELIVYFDCILPNKTLPFSHTYKMPFYYKNLKNILKPEMVKRLQYK